jgi:hypothetical protein
MRAPSDKRHSILESHDPSMVGTPASMRAEDVLKVLGVLASRSLHVWVPAGGGCDFTATSCARGTGEDLARLRAHLNDREPA